ncbi:ROK family protein [Rhodovulum sp. DZ06]|uniref:ROK family protein n=1 Tax=Rhodovulum sp. DZ06 TaxID=3425126 RepID=UPI003D34C493
MRGGDGRKLRAFNERLVLSAVLGAEKQRLSKAEIARATGLSGQAARMITDALTEEGLLRKLSKVRGQVGQPSTPYAPDPDGAFSLGVKIGRRKLETVLVNLVGEVVAADGAPHDAPWPEPTMAAACAMARGLLGALPPARRARVTGLGVAMPGDLHAWPEEMGVAPDALSGWKGIDPAAILSEATGIEAELINDGAAACAAEAFRGGGAAPGGSMLYFHIGAFCGGGLMIDGRLQRGARGNAGALASMPIGGRDARGRPRQLLHVASSLVLERMLDAQGLGGPNCVGEPPFPARQAVFETWASEAAPALARAAASACAVYDFEDVVIDGVLWGGWRRQLVHMVRRSFLDGANLSGLSVPRIGPGALGGDARVLGAALLPLHERFSPDPGRLTPHPRGA